MKKNFLVVGFEFRVMMKLPSNDASNLVAEVDLPLVTNEETPNMRIQDNYRKKCSIILENNLPERWSRIYYAFHNSP